MQSTKPITSRVEMRGDACPGTDPEAAAVRAGLRESVIDSSTYGRAIAAFERELVTRNSAYDRYVNGDDDVLSDPPKRGLELFFTRAGCAHCHSGPMFSNFEFVVQGVPQEGPGKSNGDDRGRAEHTGDAADDYAFRTPSLRNVELTPPLHA